MDAVRLDTHDGICVHFRLPRWGKTILAHRPRENVEEIIVRHELPEVPEQTILAATSCSSRSIRSKSEATPMTTRGVKELRCVAARLQMMMMASHRWYQPLGAQEPHEQIDVLKKPF